MVDMASIAAAIGGLKSAGDLAKAIIQIKSDVDRNAKVIELQSVILAAQSSAIAAQSDQFTMLEEVRKAKEELAAMKNWDAEKQRYQLASPHAGAMVQALKKEMSGGEIPHYLCANCFEKSRKSILSVGNDKDRWTFWGCPECKSKAMTGYAGRPTAKYAEDISPPQ